jgi:uncharacterized protein (TIGR04141 family)
MSKSRPFSVYLLKSGYDASNALKEFSKLESETAADKLPAGAQLFILDGPPSNVWWTSYFGVQKVIKQASKGAVVFFPVGQRCFALSFGAGYHGLKDESYEHDFGLRVTLNCVDPKKLKSTDTMQPGAARRQRIQSPVGEELTYFDFDRNSSVLRSLTGKVAEKYKNLFKDATGASSLNIKSTSLPNGLTGLCEKLLELYESESYRATFPDIQNIIPVRDPQLLDELGNALVTAVRTKAENLYLSIPDMIDYRKGAHYAAFSGVGKSDLYEDVFIDKYYEYLENNSVDLSQTSFDDLKHQRLNLIDENENEIDSFAMQNCFIFETPLGQEGQTYHIADGKWYRVENSYLARLKDTLDPLCAPTALPPYCHENEGHYNESMVGALGYICLDEKNISPDGQTQVEPCDLYSVEDGTAIFHHIKRSTLSGALSHLFNQGTNAIELLKLEPKAIEKLQELVMEKAIVDSAEGLLNPIKDGKFGVVFGIVTHKNQKAKSENLPLFSRISLMRSARWLKVSGTQCKFGFIEDKSPKKQGISKTRRKKVPAQPVSQTEIISS